MSVYSLATPSFSKANASAPGPMQRFLAARTELEAAITARPDRHARVALQRARTAFWTAYLDLPQVAS